MHVYYLCVRGSLHAQCGSAVRVGEIYTNISIVSLYIHIHGCNICMFQRIYTYIYDHSYIFTMATCACAARSTRRAARLFTLASAATNSDPRRVNPPVSPLGPPPASPPPPASRDPRTLPPASPPPAPHPPVSLRALPPVSPRPRAPLPVLCE